jgi:uncharacterized protein (UPF0335 family)
MSDTVGIAGGQILAFIERIEQIETEIAELNEGKKETFAEAKGEGFDVKVMRQVLRIRRQKPHERAETEELLEVYKAALGMM